MTGIISALFGSKSAPGPTDAQLAAQRDSEQAARQQQSESDALVAQASQAVSRRKTLGYIDSARKQVLGG